MSTALFSATVFAAAWNVPTNVRIVQKSNTDTTGRIYSTIQAAINSITNASATNPYVVKVMPGVYDLGSASLQMKEFVDLEGSGQDNTIITSANANADRYSCAVGTVLMANNSAIRQIKVVNNPPTQSTKVNATALVFDNVKAKAEGVTVITGSDTVNGGLNTGVSSCGESAHAILNNVEVEAHNNWLESIAIYLINGSSLTLTNSKLSASMPSTASGDVGGINSQGAINPGTVTVSNSTIELTAPNSWVHALYTWDTRTSVANSTITLNGLYPDGFHNNESFSMVNSKITANVALQHYFADPTKAKIANSLLQGTSESLMGVKLVNNYDENFNQIPNQ